MNEHYIRDQHEIDADRDHYSRVIGMLIAVALSVACALFSIRTEAAIDRITVSVWKLIDLANGKTIAQSFTSCNDAVRAAFPNQTSSSKRLRCYQDFTLYYKAGTPIPPPTCPALPASRQHQCTAPQVGSWTQTPTMGAPPACTVSWSPASAPAGACTTPSSETFTQCGPENGVCAGSGYKRVCFAANVAACADANTDNDRKLETQLPTSCTNERFGDPAYGVVKACFVSNVVVTPPVEPPPSNPGIASLSWTAPTRNVDNSTLTNLAGYRIYYGPSSTQLSNVVPVPNASTTAFVIGNLASGTYYFSVRAYTTNEVESANSNLVQKVISQ